jgi:hypothetical protein
MGFTVSTPICVTVKYRVFVCGDEPKQKDVVPARKASFVSRLSAAWAVLCGRKEVKP